LGSAGPTQGEKWNGTKRRGTWAETNLWLRKGKATNNVRGTTHSTCLEGPCPLLSRKEPKHQAGDLVGESQLRMFDCPMKAPPDYREDLLGYLHEE